MSSLLEQLQDNEAVLLMYLAGELPEVDRAEVEQRLAGDAKLRAELESVRALHDNAMSALAALDAGRTFNADASVRQIMRAMTRHQLESATRTPAIKPAEPRRRIGWLKISTAAAAVIAVGFVAWSQHGAPTNVAINPTNPVVIEPVSPSQTPEGNATAKAVPPVAGPDLEDEAASNLAQVPEDTLHDEADREMASLSNGQQTGGFLDPNR